MKNNLNAFRGRLWGLLLTVLLATTPGFAAAYQINFQETVSFGDSLTHNDFLGFIYGNPQSMYGADPHEAVFDKAALPDDNLTNYAIAGSESDDLIDQVDLYEFWRNLGSQDDATIIGLEIGGNDILNNVNLLKSYAPGENANADAVIDNLIQNLRRSLLTLKRSHPPSTRFIIWTLPDITLTPLHYGNLSQLETSRVQAHLQRVNRLIRNADQYDFIAVIDIYKIIRTIAINPPVIKGQQLQGTPAYGEFDAIFADEIHPTAVTNALLANVIITKINARWGDNIPLYTEDELADLARIQ